MKEKKYRVGENIFSWSVWNWIIRKKKKSTRRKFLAKIGSHNVKVFCFLREAKVDSLYSTLCPYMFKWIKFPSISIISTKHLIFLKKNHSNSRSGHIFLFFFTVFRIRLQNMSILDFWSFRLKPEKENKIARFWFCCNWCCLVFRMMYSNRQKGVVLELFSERKPWISIRSTFFSILYFTSIYNVHLGIYNSGINNMFTH